jgi:hypothetical protein
MEEAGIPWPADYRGAAGAEGYGVTKCRKPSGGRRSVHVLESG